VLFALQVVTYERRTDDVNRNDHPVKDAKQRFIRPVCDGS
jgi:hypothetical protein